MLVTLKTECKFTVNHANNTLHNRPCIVILAKMKAHTQDTMTFYIEPSQIIRCITNSLYHVLGSNDPDRTLVDFLPEHLEVPCSMPH